MDNRNRGLSRLVHVRTGARRRFLNFWRCKPEKYGYAHPCIG